MSGKKPRGYKPHRHAIKGADLPETHPDYIALITSALTLITVLIKWITDYFGNRKRSDVVAQQHQEVMGEVKKNTDISLTAAAAAVESTGMPVDEILQSENAKYLKEQFDKYRAQRHPEDEVQDADKEQETEESRRGTRKEQAG